MLAPRPLSVTIEQTRSVLHGTRTPRPDAGRVPIAYRILNKVALSGPLNISPPPSARPRWLALMSPSTPVDTKRHVPQHVGHSGEEKHERADEGLRRRAGDRAPRGCRAECPPARADSRPRIRSLG